ncbi:LPXTG cell wall anchor domain-containing protein [Microbacterium galbinum]|uniref:LPXTG cell wall anchor domain-containing protein n=1 Tax=Microbacterium galbinum TaxID=2851646 RepID=A0ABY4IP37_9MICO|nr:LPXTG cell wall anchor domain-containing protein [Microbacterium galbinum]UPL13400.1 LPXTG cell wall anchor domain-containing protein [Microbacterium galbinum]
MRRRLAILPPALVAAGILAAAPVILAAAPAWAAPTTEVIQGRVLRLVSVADWARASRLLPGEPVQWDVAVSASPPDPGTVTIAVSAAGDAPLLVDAALCMQEWQESGCPGGAEELESGWSIPRDGSEVALAAFPSTDVAHLRLWITLDADGDNGITDVRVHAQGVGEAVVTGPGGDPLPATGGSIAPWATGAGVGLAVAGIGLVGLRRRDRRGAQIREGDA